VANPLQGLSVLSAPLNNLRARVVEEDNSEVIWLDLLKADELPNSEIVSKGKTWPTYP
jgi:hypothetical protein